jgi:hypothetical protein
LPTAGDTPAIAAASSLERPIAIAFQNGHRSARCRTGGLPGDRSLGLRDRFDLNFFCFINTSVMDVLQRLVESTLGATYLSGFATSPTKLQPRSDPQFFS